MFTWTPLNKWASFPSAPERAASSRPFSSRCAHAQGLWKTMRTQCVLWSCEGVLQQVVRLAGTKPPVHCSYFWVCLKLISCCCISGVKKNGWKIQWTAPLFMRQWGCCGGISWEENRATTERRFKYSAGVVQPSGEERASNRGAVLYKIISEKRSEFSSYSHRNILNGVNSKLLWSTNSIRTACLQTQTLTGTSS